MMENVLIDLAGSYGIEGMMLAGIIAIVVIFDKKISKRDDRNDELSDMLLTTVKENTNVMSKLVTIIEERR